MAAIRRPAKAAQAALFAVPALAAFLATAPPAAAQATAPDPATLCAFRPQSPPCEALYRKALAEPDDPGAQAVKAAMEGYGRYVKNAKGGLTDQDHRFLAQNGIPLPPGDLTEEDQAGLHAVINDPAFSADADAHQRAVNNFLSRAVQAELFCAFNICAAAPDAGALAAK